MIALLLQLASAAPVVAVQADDDTLRGTLILALVDEGFTVTPARDAASHDVTIATRADGGFVVTCAGAESKGADVPAGAPELVALELRHRVGSLVRQTPPRSPPATAPPGIVPQVVDRSGLASEHFPELIAAALLEAGLTLSPLESAAERLCVDAGAATVAVSWGPAGRCEGRPVGLERGDLVPRVVVMEALRLRDAAPLRTAPRPVPTIPSSPTTSTPPSLPSAPLAPADGPPAPPADATPAPAETAPPVEPGPVLAAATPAPAAAPAIGAVTSTAPAPSGNVLVTARAAALGRFAAVDPAVEGAVLWRAWGDVGPLLVVAGSGALSPFLITEALGAVGVGGAWDVADSVRVCAGVGVGGFAHAFQFDDTDAGVAFDGAFVVPVSVDWRFTESTALSLALTAGTVGRDREHRINDEAAWSRSGLFASVSAGLAFDMVPAGGSDGK